MAVLIASADFMTGVARLSDGVSLDQARAEAGRIALAMTETHQEVNADLEEGQRLGITGTPMIFINGRALSGAKPFEELAEVIEDELRRGRR